MLKYQIIQFIIAIIIGMLFNPMNMLAYKYDHVYISLTAFYGGLLMATNMIWSHEIVNYLSGNKMNINILLFGIMISSIVTIFLLRKQFLIDDRAWMRRMITHHSTALTTSNKIINKTKNEKIKQLAKHIIVTQEHEIKLMKKLLNE